jgi:hypothetical protein
MLSLSTKGRSHVAVQAGKTTKHPSEYARKAWLNLKTLNKPINDLEKFNLQQKFNRSKLKAESTYPDDWFSELKIMVIKLDQDYNIAATDAQLLQHIVWKNHVKMYQVTLQMIKREPLVLENVKREIRQIWSQSQSNKGNVNSYYMNRKETALLTMQPHGRSDKKTFAKKFKGDCRICGKKGHKASDCWENPNKGKKPVSNNKSTSPNNTNNRFKLKCSYCGEDNHTVEKCFKRIKAETPEIAEVALITICEDGIYDGIDEPYYENTYNRADYEYTDDNEEYCSLSYKQDIKMERNTIEVDPNMWIMEDQHHRCV